MIYRESPRQVLLFDRVEEILHPKAQARLDGDWPGVFRRAILQLMPVDRLGEDFSYDFGRPTKEHYSICGLILLKDYFGWTNEDTIDKYLYDLKVQYALKIQPDNLQFGIRTLERYLKLFREKELAQKIMDDVTVMIIKELNIEVDKQRLDSTHVFSNMAGWSRSMLLFKTTRRFLVQVKRHESRLYDELDKDLREHYESQGTWIYGDVKTRNVRYGQHICNNHEQLGWDMLRLIERFEKHPKLSNMNTFKDMVRIFGEQCEIDDGKVKIRKHPGGKALINPSDPDASIDNKGVGYQVQISETYNPENPVQIITAALPQTASESDQNAVSTMLEKMENAGAKPEILLADSGYGSDENVVTSAQKDVKLIAPATGKDAGNVGLEECELDSEQRIIKCPLGRHPLFKKFDGEKGRAVFAADVCGSCRMLKQCSSSKNGKNYVITYDARSLRLRERRLHEKTKEFREDYRMRSGEEALFGRLKQFTPLRRLGIRGKTAVYNAIYSITAVHNIMQMAGFYKKQRIQKQKMTANKPETAFFTTLFRRTCQLLACEQQMAA